MSGNFYRNSPMFNTNTDFGSEWPTDANFEGAELLNFDSPQTDNQELPDLQGTQREQNLSGTQVASAATTQQQTEQQQQQHTSQPRQSHITVPHDSSSHPSSTSGQSSQSSASPSDIKHPQPTHQSTASFAQGRAHVLPNQQVSHIKTEEGFGGFGSSGNFFPNAEDSLFQNGDANMNSDMDNLSLQSNFDFNSASANDAFNAETLFASNADELNTADFGLSTQTSFESPQPRTIQPQKTFQLGPSREESPNDSYMFDKESPSLGLGTGSPLTGNPAVYGNGMASDTNATGFSFAPWNATSSNLNNGMSSPTATSGPASKWSHPLTVGEIPDKSRVETQIPIKLTLFNPPAGIKKIHLPSHSISKPKFQQKPPHEPSADTLELSVMLFCTSAMQKQEGDLLNKAFQRAESDEIPVRKEKTDKEEEDDPERPVNGAPVAICHGCTTRERKRAARKKTKKPDEEEEWLKDEAKRVIVFNCAEVKDWCVPDVNKETPVKEHAGPLSAMVVHMPMRIACYCRHHNEKAGFQVIFTLKTHEGKTVTQNISQSIMITDDHKQPPGLPQPTMSFAPTGMVDQNGMFYPSQQYGMYDPPSQGHDLPFRPSYSTPNLRNLQGQYNQNFGQLPRQFSSNNLATQSSTASATPRNLSRPASPTGPPGQRDAKKRRSGGSTNKIPSNLHMTSMESHRNPTSGGANGGLRSAPTSAGFNFTSPSASTFGATALDHSMAQASLRTPTHMASGPSTPLHPPTSNFGGDGDLSFYSAPTSQHASRAPSPTSTSRAQYAGSNLAFSNPAQQMAPDALMAAHLKLPQGINFNRLPTIKKIVPDMGPTSGGQEVSILGNGFLPGIEVMFGDQPATQTDCWSDTTLICKVPPSNGSGMVTVCFKHQYENANSQQANDVKGLMPSETFIYKYFDAARMPNYGQPQPTGFPRQNHSGMGTPPGSGSMSPPGMTSIGGMTAAGSSAEDLSAGLMGPRQYMGFPGQAQGMSGVGAASGSGMGGGGMGGGGGGMGGPGGPGSAGFNAASFARTQQAQQEAAQAVARGGRMGAMRSMSGNQGFGR